MAKHQLVIELPENASLPERVQQNQALLRNAIAVTLYKLGELSLEEARNLMGLSRREFEEILSEYWVTMMDERDFTAEQDAARKLSA